MQARLLAVIVATLLAVAIGLVAPAASADPRTSFLADQLKNDDDYRVRTQAALALGASKDKAAVKPLCGGLNDSNVSVRVAAAAALGKLGEESGVKCLKARESKEKASAVKKQISKSIEKLEGGGGGGVSAPPKPKSGDKYYVAVDIKNKTKRSNGEVEAIVRGQIQKQLLSSGGYAMAPAGESPSAGKKVVSSNGLTGYYLIATVEEPKYSGGNLTQVVRVSMWTYPDKALKGEFAPKLTQSGTPKEDKQSEELLMRMCTENAVNTFKKVVKSL